MPFSVNAHPKLCRVGEGTRAGLVMGYPILVKQSAWALISDSFGCLGLWSRLDLVTAVYEGLFEFQK